MCSCEHFDHTFRTLIDEDDGSVYFEIHLSPRGFFERVRNAVLYVLGKRSRFGDFDSFSLKTEDVQRLKESLEYAQEVERNVRR